MSAPVPNANYAPNGYERVSPGHYRRHEDDPEARATERAIQSLNQFDPDDWKNFVHKKFPFPSATEANRLDDIATLVRLLTYGEMMDLTAAVWKMRQED